jgi:hypothetical protein
MWILRRLARLVWLGGLCLVVACGSAPVFAPARTPNPQPIVTATSAPVATGTPTLEFTPEAGVTATQEIPPGQSTPSAGDTLLWVDENLPSAVRDGLGYEPGLTQVEDADRANLKLTFELGASRTPIGKLSWIYVLAARFATVTDNVSSGDLRQVWKGSDGKGHVILLDQETMAAISMLWGQPGPTSVHVVPAAKLLDEAWKNPQAWVLLPFEAVGPGWKVLRVDGFSVLDRQMDEKAYPLAVRIGLFAENSVPDTHWAKILPTSNREAQKLLTLAMTGTTALVRKTAKLMNERGVTYPANDIGSLLRSADLTHISNEVSFYQDCVPARAASGEGIFCSAPDYIKLLEALGTDIVELTGNHNLDKGVEGYLYTLQEYQKRNWSVYGGGLNQTQAGSVLKIERGETKLAFLGCNMAGPEIAWASKDQPGAARCNMDLMVQTIQQLRKDGYLPVVTFQAFETEDYMPAPMQQPSDFTRMAEAGAMIISGSQAHFPQGFALRPGSMVHFGLGNLFFDQVEPEPIRRSFIDWHVFYAGRYLGMQLVSVMLEDFGRPRLMTADERATFLTDVFQANGWKP